MSLRAVTDGDWDEVVLSSPVPVLADFWAPWCVPCAGVTALVEQVAAEHRGRLTAVSVNVDDQPRLAGRYAILGVPTLILFAGGQPVERLDGNIRAKRLAKALAPHVDQE